MSLSVNKPSASVPAETAAELAGVVRAIAAAAPGVVQSVMVVANVHDAAIDGVVLDPDEPGGGYVSYQELVAGVVYLVLGVGTLGVGNVPAGIHVLNEWLP